ncbi:hypothetical protein FBEOM_1859 [Fusarium beomiforme]|uniref:Uncharacterized protein n=1 Tax=Fusarium beomiforme TaxID=44412 RepID=A0A9P5ASI9_9HYPO|nr:hypothetical protein FBEOM_1859 [Fusarium beomiforme]
MQTLPLKEHQIGRSNGRGHIRRSNECQDQNIRKLLLESLQSGAIINEDTEKYVSGALVRSQTASEQAAEKKVHSVLGITDGNTLANIDTPRSVYGGSISSTSCQQNAEDEKLRNVLQEGIQSGALTHEDMKNYVCRYLVFSPNIPEKAAEKKIEGFLSDNGASLWDPTNEDLTRGRSGGLVSSTNSQQRLNDEKLRIVLQKGVQSETLTENDLERYVWNHLVFCPEIPEQAAEQKLEGSHSDNGASLGVTIRTGVASGGFSRPSAEERLQKLISRYVSFFPDTSDQAAKQKLQKFLSDHYNSLREDPTFGAARFGNLDNILDEGSEIVQENDGVNKADSYEHQTEHQADNIVPEKGGPAEEEKPTNVDDDSRPTKVVKSQFKSGTLTEGGVTEVKGRDYQAEQKVDNTLSMNDVPTEESITEPDGDDFKDTITAVLDNSDAKVTGLPRPGDANGRDTESGADVAGESDHGDCEDRGPESNSTAEDDPRDRQNTKCLEQHDFQRMIQDIIDRCARLGKRAEQKCEYAQRLALHSIQYQFLVKQMSIIKKNLDEHHQKIVEIENAIKESDEEPIQRHHSSTD